jgi:hypothetical protein
MVYFIFMLVFKNIYNLFISAVEIRRFYFTYIKYEVINGRMIKMNIEKLPI